MATSRETLNVPGEAILRVPSLSFPLSRHLLPGEKLADYESVRLLLERARAIKTDFNLNQDNVSSVARICRRLEGMPLAIELAAARLKVLPIEQIAARLDDRFSLLTTGSHTTLPRHQTLQAVIDWSYDLLSEKERAFLCCLAVFVGGWTLEAAEAVCGEDIPAHEVIDYMASLVDKSLVEAAEAKGGEARYRMLETMRQYGQERFQEAGQMAVVQHSHALFFAELAEKAEQGLRDTGMHIWYERLEAEHDNFRSALEWSLAHETPAFCLRFAGALGIFWHRGYLYEGLTYLDRLLEYGKDEPAQLRVKAMVPASWLARDLGNYEKATILNEESLKVLRAVGDKFGMADVLIQGGLLAVYKDNPQCATACFNESLALSEEVGYTWGRARSLVNLAHAAFFNLEWNEAARAYGEESLQLFRELGDATEEAHALIILGPGAHYEGDDQRGRALIEQAITICRQAGDKRQLAWATSALSLMIRWQGKRGEALSTAKEGLRLADELGEKSIMVFVSLILGVLAKDRGKLEQALHLFGSAIAWGESFGYRLTPLQWDIIRRDVDALRATLGEEAFDQAWEEGRAMPFKKALQDALQD
jgi:predicted ATPase